MLQQQNSPLGSPEFAVEPKWLSVFNKAEQIIDLLCLIFDICQFTDLREALTKILQFLLSESRSVVPDSATHGLGPWEFSRSEY